MSSWLVFDIPDVCGFVCGMASVKRRPDSAQWVACYSAPDGRRFQRSTKLTNRKEALKVAEAWEAAYRGKQTETKVRRVMGEIFEEIHAKPLTTYSLAEWAATWLSRVKPEMNPKTHGRYSEVVDTLKRLAPELAATPLDAVTTDAVLAFRAKLLEVRSATTVNQSLKVWRSCLKAAWDAGVVTDNPFARVKRVRGEPPVQKQPFTVEQIKALLAAADDEWKGMILAGLYSGGQRIGDISMMEVRQVDLDGGAVRFTTDKTGREVVIPLVPAWREYLTKRIK
jgi:integrase